MFDRLFFRKFHSPNSVRNGADIHALRPLSPSPAQAFRANRLTGKKPLIQAPEFVGHGFAAKLVGKSAASFRAHFRPFFRIVSQILNRILEGW
jgi:hypothetical protein